MRISYDEITCILYCNMMMISFTLFLMYYKCYPSILLFHCCNDNKITLYFTLVGCSGFCILLVVAGPRLQFWSIFSQTSFLAHLRNFLKWNFFLCDLLFIKLVNEVTIDFFWYFRGSTSTNLIGTKLYLFDRIKYTNSILTYHTE